MTTRGWKIRIAPALLASVCITACAGTGGTAPGTGPDYAALVASPDRSAADRETDARRRPAQMLAFIGARPGMKALDVGAGGGYTTELLARAAGPRGTVYAQNTRPRDALDERLKKPVMKNTVAVIRSFDDPVPPQAQGLDVVTLILNYHDIAFMDVDRAAMNRKIFDALKPGGHYVLVDHSAKPGEGTSVAKTLHRIEEASLQQEVEAAGFKLQARGDFLRNPQDPRTAPFHQISLPSDKFVLKFVKPGT